MGILIQISFSGRLSWFLGQKPYFENWKCQVFDKSASSCLIRYQKILWGGSLGCKNLLKFTCLTMKFHNRHHANEGLVNFDDLNLMDDDSPKLIVYDDLFDNLIADAEGYKVVKNLL